jgi:alginate O-acetyltransferase complex protein AlgI
MLFNSYVFIFIFLPLALGGWYLLNHFGLRKTACVFISGMSFWFYAYFNIKYLFLLLFSIAMNYFLSFLIHTAEQKGSLSGTARRFFLLLGIGSNLALFFYFKYLDFFIENVNALFRTDWPLQHILLPLGISFFTFQQLSFVIDRAKGTAKHYPLLNYVTFVTFFPQLIAGPIVLYDEMMPQFDDPARRRFDPDHFARGLVLFTIGLGKKVLLADTLAAPANYGFSIPGFLDTGGTVLVVLSYTFELYFDFSGYCDMAMGIGKMFNIDLPVNFNSPYISCSIREFWQRWHITLGRFFTKYVYYPLGGSRGSTLRTVSNVFIVFALSGLWHGAAWTYIAWGVVHGLCIIWEDLGITAPAPVPGQKQKHFLLKGAPFITIPRRAARALTFFIFCLSLIFFRSDSMQNAFLMFRTLLHPVFPGYMRFVAQKLTLSETWLIGKAIEQYLPSFSWVFALLVWLLLLAFSFWIVFTRKNSQTLAEETAFSKKQCIALAVLFLWCVISLSHVSTFLYFNF